MDRRTILRRLGIGAAGVTGIAGTAAAADPEGDGLLNGYGLEVDVSDVSAPTPLAELVSDETLEKVDDATAADVSPREVKLNVDEGTNVVTTDVCCDKDCCEDYGGYCESWCLCCGCTNCSQVIASK